MTKFSFFKFKKPTKTNLNVTKTTKSNKETNFKLYYQQKQQQQDKKNPIFQ